jgi:hypothetical protein
MSVHSQAHFDNLVHDFRYALRSLSRDRRFAFLAILTLALGIGAATSIFSIVDNVVRAKLRAVAENMESATFASFNACNDGTELLIFFSHYVQRILGVSASSEHSAFENEMSGVRRQITDPILAASVCGMFIKVSTATKEFLERTPIDWFPPKT